MQSIWQPAPRNSLFPILTKCCVNVILYPMDDAASHHPVEKPRMGLATPFPSGFKQLHQPSFFPQPSQTARIRRTISIPSKLQGITSAQPFDPLRTPTSNLTAALDCLSLLSLPRLLPARKRSYGPHSFSSLLFSPHTHSPNRVEVRFNPLQAQTQAQTPTPTCPHHLSRLQSRRRAARQDDRISPKKQYQCCWIRTKLLLGDGFVDGD